jgi:transposase-like protein
LLSGRAPYPHSILEARYEKVREAGVILSRAMLVEVAVDSEDRGQILGVDLANRGSHSSWRDLLASSASAVCLA